MRFRFNSIAVLADIKQAFLNVEVSTEHSDYLRFLCYDDVASENEAKPIIYRLLRVAFDITSSTSLLNCSIRLHFKKFVESDQKFITKFIEA